MKRNRIPALLLAMLLTLSLSVSAFAAGSTMATVPVTLTVDNQYRAVNVTVPSSLPVYVTNGTVITADNAKIKQFQDRRGAGDGDLRDGRGVQGRQL